MAKMYLVSASSQPQATMIDCLQLDNTSSASSSSSDSTRTRSNEFSSPRNDDFGRISPGPVARTLSDVSLESAESCGSAQEERSPQSAPVANHAEPNDESNCRQDERSHDQQEPETRTSSTMNADGARRKSADQFTAWSPQPKRPKFQDSGENPVRPRQLQAQAQYQAHCQAHLQTLAFSPIAATNEPFQLDQPTNLLYTPDTLDEHSFLGDTQIFEPVEYEALNASRNGRRESSQMICDILAANQPATHANAELRLHESNRKHADHSSSCAQFEQSAELDQNNNLASQMHNFYQPNQIQLHEQRHLYRPASQVHSGTGSLLQHNYDNQLISQFKQDQQHVSIAHHSQWAQDQQANKQDNCYAFSASVSSQMHSHSTGANLGCDQQSESCSKRKHQPSADMYATHLVETNIATPALNQRQCQQVVGQMGQDYSAQNGPNSVEKSCCCQAMVEQNSNRYVSSQHQAHHGDALVSHQSHQSHQPHQPQQTNHDPQALHNLTYNQQAAASFDALIDQALRCDCQMSHQSGSILSMTDCATNDLYPGDCGPFEYLNQISSNQQQAEQHCDDLSMLGVESEKTYHLLGSNANRLESSHDLSTACERDKIPQDAYYQREPFEDVVIPQISSQYDPNDEIRQCFATQADDADADDESEPLYANCVSAGDEATRLQQRRAKTSSRPANARIQSSSGATLELPRCSAQTIQKLRHFLERKRMIRPSSVNPFLPNEPSNSQTGDSNRKPIAQAAFSDSATTSTSTHQQPRACQRFTRSSTLRQNSDPTFNYVTGPKDR